MLDIARHWRRRHFSIPSVPVLYLARIVLSIPYPYYTVGDKSVNVANFLTVSVIEIQWFGQSLPMPTMNV